MDVKALAASMVSQYQQTAREYAEAIEAILAQAPGKVLVYGVGKDSGVWARLNAGGRTLFVEHDAAWIAQVRASNPSLEIMQVTYPTTVAGSLRAGLQTTFETGAGKLDDWRVIIVDAPTGGADDNPGREAPIREASIAARRVSSELGVAVDVFVHDVDRALERAACEKYFAGEPSASYDRSRHIRVGGKGKGTAAAPRVPPPLSA